MDAASGADVLEAAIVDRGVDLFNSRLPVVCLVQNRMLELDVFTVFGDAIIGSILDVFRIVSIS